MQKARFFPIAFAIAASLSALAFSAPVYYTFSGKVNLVPADQGGYAAAHGIHAGSPVTFYFAVDNARQAFTRFDGVMEVKPDIGDPGSAYHADYFFDSLLAPSLFSPAVADTGSGSFFGYRTTTQIGASSRYSLAFQTIIGNPDHGTQILISLPDSGAADFLPKVGTVVSATEAYTDSSAASSSASMTLTLTAVGNTRPNALRFVMPVIGNWLSAEWTNGFLFLQNRSGAMAKTRILDGNGKTVLSRSLAEKAAISVVSLPRGRLFLEVTASGQTAPVRRAFFH